MRQDTRCVSADAAPGPQTTGAALNTGPLHTPDHASHTRVLSVDGGAPPAAQQTRIPATASPPKATCRGVKPRRSRRRPEHEIRQLRTQIQELELELQARWTAASARSRRSLRARATNRELKAKVQLSVERAKALEAQLQAFAVQRRAAETLLPSPGVLGSHVAFDKARDTAIFAVLARSVDENYLKLGQVYREVELENASTGPKNVRVQTTGEQSGVLKLRTVNAVPFSLQTVLGAIRRALEAEMTADSDVGTQALDMGLDSRTLIMKRGLVLRDRLKSPGASDGTVSCTIRVLLKKYVEPGREVHVWDSFGDWPWAVTTRELGWAVIEPMDPLKKEAAGAAEADITLVQNCIFLKSSKRGPESTGEPANETPQDFVVRLYQQIMDARQQAVENALLDQSREW